MTIRDSLAAYTAALWALIFMMLHTVWAAGWYVGLDQEMARKAFQQRWFLVYDLVVAAMCAVAAGVALALVQPWGTRLPRRLRAALAMFGTVVLALRGGAGAIQSGYLAAAGRNVQAVFWFWDVWFCVGALLFGISSWTFLRVAHGPAPAR